MCLGRCSHVCNAGFLTTTAARNRGVGMVMGEAYLDYAPKLVRGSSVRNGQLTDEIGLQILRIQPGLREQRRLCQDLGKTRLPGDRPGARRRSPGQQRRPCRCLNHWKATRLSCRSIAYATRHEA